MSRRVFTSAVLLLVVLMCAPTDAAHAAGGILKESVDALKGMTWKSLPRLSDISNAREICGSLRGPSLVEVRGHVFAIAEVQCKADGDTIAAGIALKHLDVSSGGPVKISTADASIFAAGFLWDDVDGSTIINGRTCPTTIVLGDDIYMLVGNYSRIPSGAQTTKANGWGLLLVKGSLADESERKKIRWSETHAVNLGSNGPVHSLTELVGGGGSGVVMEDGRLVFPMQAIDNTGKSVLLSMHLAPSEKNWELSSRTTRESCGDPSIVKWNDAKLLMMAFCDAGYYNVYRAFASGAHGFESGEQINRVWGNSYDRKGSGVQSGFITATVEGGKVMLITTPVYSEKETGKGSGQLHLWLTDSARVYDVGAVSREGDDAAASSLLMKREDETLILLYEKKEGDESHSLVAVHLTDKLEQIKSVVRKWRELDNALRSCSSSSGGDSVATRGMCGGRVPTGGLVGFLSGDSTETEWRDEYLGVNATVTDGTRGVLNGFTFKGAGAGAEWPVGKRGQNVPYYFANNEFTLVATVSIHEVPGSSSGPIPLIGVRMNDEDSTVLFGLSYTHKKEWMAIADDPGSEERVVLWEPNTTYQVVLRMTTSFWYVFVDGTEINNRGYKADLFRSHRISHFYIGGDSKDKTAKGGHVTVTNVLLYNEELLAADIKALNASKVTIPSLGAEEQPTKPEDQPVVSKRAPVASQEASGGESGTSHATSTEKDSEQQKENNISAPIPEVPVPPVGPASSVPEVATAAGTTETSRPRDGVHPPQDGTVQHATSNKDAGSVQRDEGPQTRHPQSEESAVVNDVEGSFERHDPQKPEEGGTKDESGRAAPSVATSLSTNPAAGPVVSGHKVPQATGLPLENNKVQSTGSETTGAKQDPGLEVEDTDDISQPEGVESSVANGEEVSQVADTPPGNNNTVPGPEGTPSTRNAAQVSGNDSFDFSNTELPPISASGDSTVRGCAPRVPLLLLLGLWGVAALR